MTRFERLRIWNLKTKRLELIETFCNTWIGSLGENFFGDAGWVLQKGLGVLKTVNSIYSLFVDLPLTKRGRIFLWATGISEIDGQRCHRNRPFRMCLLRRFWSLRRRPAILKNKSENWNKSDKESAIKTEKYVTSCSENLRKSRCRR